MSDTSVRPLRGLRVLELAHEVGAMFCGRVLNWLGAEVVRVEGDAEDSAARWSVGDDGFGVAAYDYCNAGKTIVRTARVDDEAARLLPDVDIALSDRPLERLRAAGLDPAALRGGHGKLVLVSLTGFGLTGPYAGRPATELTTYHAGGEGYLLPGNPVFGRYPDRPPVRGGRFLAEYDAGLAAVLGTLAAVYRRTRTGRGDVVEISAQEVQIGLNRTSLSRCFHEGRDADRSDRGYDYGGILEAADGWVTLRPTEDGHWRSFARAIGRPDLADDPRFAGRPARDANGAELTRELLTWTRARTRREIREVILAAECPGGPFLEMDEVLADPVLVDRGLFAETAGGLAPGRLFETLEIGEPVEPVEPAGRRGPAEGYGPLAGVRVLDLTWVAAGPYATELLAFLGAEVFKIESRERPDLFRRLLQEESDDLDTSIRFVDLNQHKRSVCLDLKTSGGREALVRLAAACDVVIDNFRPGVRARLGIGDAELRRRNPRLVSAALSGFGATGAMRARPGYASVFNAESGVGAMTGYADGPPTEIRDSNDLRAGVATACAALAALVDRERHGNASSLGVAAREVLVTLQGDAVLEASRGRTPTRTGNALGRLVPYGCWPAADGRWVAVGVVDADHWRRLAETIDAPAPHDAEPADLADPAARWRWRRDVEAAVAGWLSRRPALEAVRLLGEGGVPAAVSAPASMLRDDPHLTARGLFSQVRHPKLGDLTVIGSPVRFWSDADRRPARRSPLLGEHTREVLTTVAGLAPGDVDGLFASGAAS